MVYDARDKLIKRKIGIDLLAEIPNQGDTLFKPGFIREADELNLSQLIALIRSDGTKDVDAIDDLSDLLEYLYDNRVGALPTNLVNDVSKKGSTLKKAYSATSQAKTLNTVPTNKVWEAANLTAVNSTRGWEADIIIDVDGTEYVLCHAPNYAAGQYATVDYVDLLHNIYALNGGQSIWLNAGDKIGHTDTTFVAGDGVKQLLIYREYSV